MFTFSPEELINRYGSQTPEQLAARLGFRVTRLAKADMPAGVHVLSEYLPERVIILYEEPLRKLARHRKEPLARIEQWHIAHELYHGLAEAAGISPWRQRETDADLWADELLALCPIA